MQLRPGQRIGRYELGEVIGSGGMGEVYRAVDLELERPVALKILPAEFTDDPDRLRRFRQEARSLAAVAHPGIVTIHSIEEHGNLHIMTMELVEGSTLKELLAEGEPTLPQLLDIAIDLVTAVAAAHDCGVTHRDLKPANVVIPAAGGIKVLDFGLARVHRRPAANRPTDDTEATASMHQIIGTPGYMSPEQAIGGEIGAASDIFSCGIILYEMFAGQRPFAGDTLTEITAALLRDEPRPVTEIEPRCPPHLAAAVARCLEKEPARRYASAHDLRADLVAAKGESALGFGESTPTIAVLPFADMSRERDQGYFCEGITEEIINALTRVGGLNVASRTSSFQFPPEAGDIRAIGRRLGVATVLEGSVRKADDRLRVTAQLIDVNSGYHLWSDRFDRRLADVFAVQDEIARNIVQALQVRLNRPPAEPLVPRRTGSVEAYDLYLRGRSCYLRWGRRNNEVARRLFEQAIAIDPGFALAHAGLANTCCYLYMYIDSSEENLGCAHEAARRALDLAPDLAEAHAAHGLVLSLEGRHDEAGAEFARASELDPQLFEAPYFQARDLVVRSRFAEATVHYERAAAIDPDEYQVPLLLAQVYTALGRGREADAANRHGLALAERRVAADPEDVRALYFAASAMVRLGQRERGLEWNRRALAMEPDDPGILYNAACIYANLGRSEEAIDCLARAARIGSAYRRWIENDSDLDSLRDLPRFKELLAELD